mmetsp:Transcript_68118/g.210752  ORF Transcript_68118/g.210752 Transcript_68118/m.210752 type:complete len:176 (+) Transcript_68118:467-994(+)
MCSHLRADPLGHQRHVSRPQCRADDIRVGGSDREVGVPVLARGRQHDVLGGCAHPLLLQHPLLQQISGGGPLALSAAIKAHVWKSFGSGVHVETVDMVSGFAEDLFLYDGCHPSPWGEEFMAGRWFDSVVRHCGIGASSMRGVSSSSRSSSWAVTRALRLGGIAVVCFAWRSIIS